MKSKYTQSSTVLLRRWVEQFHIYLADSSAQSRQKAAILLGKIRTLCQKLYHEIGRNNLRRLVGPLAIILGLSTASEAQSFKAPVLNPFGLDSVEYAYFFSPVTADIDDDGDLDIFSNGYYEYGVISFFENVGDKSNPSFADVVDDPFNINVDTYFALPSFADIDDDGDLDLLVGSYDYYTGPVFRFMRNVGTASNPSFAAPVNNPFGLAPPTDVQNYLIVTTFVDIDDDGDMDIVASDLYGDILFYENTGTAKSPNFAAPKRGVMGLTKGSIYGVAKVDFADLDGDGDLDALAVAFDYDGYNYESKPMYYENIGSKSNPMFTTPVTNKPFGIELVVDDRVAVNIHFCDLDDDGDMDILAGDYYGNFMFLENSQTTSIIDPEEVNLTIYPNPASDLIRIASERHFVSYTLMNETGQVLMGSDLTRQEIAISSLRSGLYVVELKDVDGNVVRSKVAVVH